MILQLELPYSNVPEIIVEACAWNSFLNIGGNMISNHISKEKSILD